MTPIGKVLIVSACGLLVAVTLLVLKHRIHGDRLQFVIDRRDNQIAMYLAAPATTLIDVFGLPASSLVEPDGTIDIGRLQEETGNLGDKLFERTRTRIGGADAMLKAMALMVHPIEDKMPLSNPIEGIVAIGVCMSDPAAPPRLPQLQAYSGFNALTLDHRAAISISLPGPGQGLSVLVRDHTGGTLQREYVTTVSETGELIFPATRNQSVLGRLADWSGVVFGAS